MAIRPNNEERSFGADRERQREISNEGGRAARSTSEGSSRGDATSALRALAHWGVRLVRRSSAS